MLWNIIIFFWGNEFDLDKRLRVDDETKKNLTLSIKSEIKQSIDLKSPERLRFEEENKHLMERVVFPNNESVKF